jgi:microcystin-dependent protein
MAFYKYDSTTNKLVPLTSEGNVGLPVGAVLSFPAGTTQAGWLLCDGSTFDRTVYPALYTYLGNSNVLPDYRECVLVGAGQNDTDTIAEHDVYTLG